MSATPLPGRVTWVESSGGPLIVIPDSVLHRWTGVSDEDDVPGDYDRTWMVGDPIGLIPVGGVDALVLGGDPDSTTYLPRLGVFVRWWAADSEEALLGAVAASLDAASWGPPILWRVPGAVVLSDAVCPGREVGQETHLVIKLEPGVYTVDAAYVRADARTAFTVVRLVQQQATS